MLLVKVLEESTVLIEAFEWIGGVDRSGDRGRLVVRHHMLKRIIILEASRIRMHHPAALATMWSQRAW